MAKAAITPVTQRGPAQHQPHVDPTLWPEIAVRARNKRLRDLADEYGVSHETIRAIVRRVAASGSAAAAP